MSCGCASRMRTILSMRGFKLEDGVWRKAGSELEVPDARIEDDHFKVLIETMAHEVVKDRIDRFKLKTRRIPT